MKVNKPKYELLDENQIDLFKRACFIYGIQVLFNFVLFMYSGVKFNFIRNTQINFALFFTVLLLHLTCLPTARDGIAMMKYALLHPDEFSHPISAFFLGFFSCSSMLAAEIVNINASQNKKTVTDAIAGFIGFKIIIDLPTLYLGSLEDF